MSMADSAVEAQARAFGLGTAVSAPGGDWNQISASGFFTGNVNGPSTAYCVGVCVRMNTSGSSWSGFQIACDYLNGGLYYRRKLSGETGSGWQSWQTLSSS